MMRRWLLYALLLVAVAIPASAQDNDAIVGPNTYPEGINPLTGLMVEDPATLERRPLLIKISNSPTIVREYQIGLNSAEIVWEHLLAGGVTRFSAVFYANDFEKIGPVRSGRLVDFELVRIYRSLFTYSGMSQGTTEVLFGDEYVYNHAVGGSGPCPPLCRFPEEGLALEHTLYGDTEAIRTDYAVEREAETEFEPVYGMAFSEDIPENGTPMASAQIRYRNLIALWEWNEDSQRWLRSTDGEAHFDSGTETQVQAVNVVIIEEEHTIQPEVRDQYWGPGNFAFSVNFIGSGRIFLLRDGQLFEGNWERETREDPLTFYDTNGNVLPFKPGNTFFNLVPLWVDGYELELVPQEPVQIEVTGDTGAAIRFGPSEDYVTPDVAYPGDTFSVIGRNFDGTWVQILRRGDDRAVWLPVDRVDVSELNVMALPLPRPANER